MRTERVSFAVVVVISFVCIANSIAAVPTIFPICTWAGEQSYPAVSGNYVVWQDKRDGALGYDIYRNNPANMKDANGQPLCVVNRDQKLSAISGNIVVCQDYRNSSTTANPDIYYYRWPSDNIGTAVCTVSACKQQNPAISENVIVWEDDRNTNTKPDIYGYDLTTGEFIICDLAAAQSYPAISGNIVVWQDSRNDISGDPNSDIYGRHIDTNVEFAICKAAGAQQKPAISGTYVVWQDNRSGIPDGDPNNDIYGKDIDTNTEFVICKAPGEQVNVAISGDIVVWEDQSGANSNIYGYKISTKETFEICTLAGNQRNPAISGNLVVWQDDSNSVSGINIYGEYLPSTVTVLDPNGGEMLKAGSTCLIQWCGSDSIRRVKIEYSKTGDVPFLPITDVNATPGSYEWQIPQDANSTQCIVKISDKDNPDTNDTSNNVFTIFKCSLTADLSGDCYVDFEDFAIFSGQWLECGNPYDPHWCP
ncbi:MAG: hypothetical protein Q7T18_01050 [Sedimentisphaerales bacterium]|nr:hypothetical protein [Sedimentisphaerales bacterium]